MSAPIVVLAGGTGGAKLARGMLDVAGEDLVVIANTGDDVEIHGGHVSPDPDLVTFWLADRVDERGWGLRDDTFTVMDALRALGEDVWFNLGDQDLAMCLARARRLEEGATLTAAADDLRRAFGVPARVLPMCDEPVRTWVRRAARWSELQDVADPRARGRAGRGRRVPRRGGRRADGRGAGGARRRPRGDRRPVEPGDLDRADPGGRGARGAARLPGAGDRRLAARRRAVAEGTNRGVPRLGGPAALERRDRRATTTALLDGLVADERTDALPTLETDVAMPDAAGRRRVAQEALDFALALG